MSLFARRWVRSGVRIGFRGLRAEPKIWGGSGKGIGDLIFFEICVSDLMSGGGGCGVRLRGRGLTSRVFSRGGATPM